MIRRVILQIAMAVLGGFMLSACDKLDDSDDGIMNEVLPGKWAFSYAFKGDVDPGLDFQYRYVLFNEDGTCALAYIVGEEPRTDDAGNHVLDNEGRVVYDAVYDALHGTYQATRAMIRIVSSDIGGEERILLWKITSFSAKRLVAEYSFNLNAQSLTAVVTLEKQ